MTFPREGKFTSSHFFASKDVMGSSYSYVCVTCMWACVMCHVAPYSVPSALCPAPAFAACGIWTQHFVVLRLWMKSCLCLLFILPRNACDHTRHVVNPQDGLLEDQLALQQSKGAKSTPNQSLRRHATSIAAQLRTVPFMTSYIQGFQGNMTAWMSLLFQ